MDWSNYKPKFECDELQGEMLKYSPWSGHRFFAYDLVTNYKPNIIVELGSFYGCSTFAFAQAVKDHNYRTEINAVDLWETFDLYTKDDYKLDIYGAFCKVQERYYSGINLNRCKMKFDEALNKFEDNSIDILHIDGSHFYEDVKHDFETWKCKLKDTAIVLFHDIGDEIINGSIMGTHRYWNEIKKEYGTTIEFEFSCGLGVLFISPQMYDEFVKKVNLNHYQKENNSLDVRIKDDLRKLYFKFGDAVCAYQKTISEIKDAYEKDKREREDAYTELIKKKDEYIEARENQLIEAYTKTISGKDEYIKFLEMQLENTKKCESRDI